MATIPDKVNTGALATVVAVGAISMIGISAALTAMVRAEQDAHELEKGTTANLRPKTDLARIATEELNKPAHLLEQGRVALPIERAMTLVVDDISKNPNRATDPTPPDAGKPAVAETPAEADAGAMTEGDAGAPAAEGADAEPTQGAEPGSKGSEPPAPENDQGAPTKPPTEEPAPKGKPQKAAPKPSEPAPPAPEPGSP